MEHSSTGTEMSNTWTTKVYFSIQSRCSYEQLARLMAQLKQAGLDFHHASNGKGQWISPDGMEFLEVNTVDEALSLVVKYGGGAFTVGNIETGIHDYMSFYPLGGGWLGDATSAEYFYGHITLHFSSINFEKFLPEDIRKRFELVFLWSNILARATDAIYGWGDFESQLLDSEFSVRATDLQRNIPRFSWWNFFSKAYVNQVGRHRLLTTGVWLAHEDETGQTLILKPPGEPDFATSKDLKTLGLI